MPKAAPEDHRPARACLAAPYPLPYIITREPAHSVPPSSQPHSTASSHAGSLVTRSLPPLSLPPGSPALPHSGPSASTPKPQPPAPGYAFPPPTHDWRAIQPAYPPIPYPPTDPAETARKRTRRLKLLKGAKEEADSSEWEVFSAQGKPEYAGKGKGRAKAEDMQVDEGVEEMMGAIRKVGVAPRGEQAQSQCSDSELVEDDRDNILLYSFFTALERGDFDDLSRPSEGLKTPTQVQQVLPAPVVRAGDTPPALVSGSVPAPYVAQTPQAVREQGDRTAESKPPANPSPSPARTPAPAPRRTPSTTPAPRAQGLHIHQTYIVDPERETDDKWDDKSSDESSFWSEGSDAEGADEERLGASPASAQVVTPSASRLADRLRAQAKRERELERSRPSRPLFLGQTNQSPFTYIPPTKPSRRPSQSSISDSVAPPPAFFAAVGGYVSEASSAGTVKGRQVRQIKRGRWSRLEEVKERREREEEERRRREYAVAGEEEGEGEGEGGSVTPKQRDFRGLPEVQQQPQLQVPAGMWIDPQSMLYGARGQGSVHASAPSGQYTLPQPVASQQYHPQPQPQVAAHQQQPPPALSRYGFAPLPTLLHPSDLSSPSSGDTFPPSNTVHLAPPAPPAQDVGGRWSPQPMSIDPRTASTTIGGASWPHPLPAREQAPPSAEALRRAEAALGDDSDVPMPTASTARAGYAGEPSAGAGKKGERFEQARYMGKACHNFLAMRKEAMRRRRAAAGLDRDKKERKGKGGGVGGGGRKGSMGPPPVPDKAKRGQQSQPQPQPQAQPQFQPEQLPQSHFGQQQQQQQQPRGQPWQQPSDRMAGQWYPQMPNQQPQQQQPQQQGQQFPQQQSYNPAPMGWGPQWWQPQTPLQQPMQLMQQGWQAPQGQQQGWQQPMPMQTPQGWQGQPQVQTMGGMGGMGSTGGMAGMSGIGMPGQQGWYPQQNQVFQPGYQQPPPVQQQQQQPPFFTNTGTSSGPAPTLTTGGANFPSNYFAPPQHQGQQQASRATHTTQDKPQRKRRRSLSPPSPHPDSILLPSAPIVPPARPENPHPQAKRPTLASHKPEPGLERFQNTWFSQGDKPRGGGSGANLAGQLRESVHGLGLHSGTRAAPPDADASDDESEFDTAVWHALAGDGYESMGEEERRRVRRHRWLKGERERARGASMGR
ncbi:hypothetical protein IAT38_001679 [Cryptococcus sp. DSM 104549]